ncbi:Uncharacterised protein [Mesomycoplasma dispar]|uniref:Uncharacterized protein n=1 Tax=Mesomycoplasma dispar TaxID=86660 RepID=A0AAJ5TCR7_9BACT|nr:hypothetical protein [Mesomycoplasma dispar]AJR12069.1 hypothetical protein MDIS_01120 [Mesomycoplasma dispar]VEU61430.1 Uncharacterised protein [Mesomycoplasma dispar]
MENQINLISNLKKRPLIELKYLEIDIKSFYSTTNVISHYRDYPDGRPKNKKIPDFLWVYSMQPDWIAYMEPEYNYINPIETVIGINYKQGDYIYNLKLEDIPKTVFFSKELKNFHFYNDIYLKIDFWEKKIRDQGINWEKYEQNRINLEPHFSAYLGENRGSQVVVVAFENFNNVEKCEFSVSYPTIFLEIFESKDELKKIEGLIIKEVQESVPYAKPKNLENYQEKIFDFLSKRYEYNSEFGDVNKKYLGEKIENIYNLLLKDKYHPKINAKIQSIQNVFTFESYNNLLEKFKKYGIKKLDLNIENRDKFIISWFDKFGSEYRKYCIELFGKKGQFYYDNLNKWTNEIEFIYLLQILFGPRYQFDNDYLTEPDYLILPSWAKLKLENFQIFYFGGEEYGFFDEIISKFDSKKPVFWYKPYYQSFYRSNLGWISPIAVKNFILLYIDGEKIYYWFCHSNLYDDIYQGKYEILKYYFKEKLVKLEKDIFLRDGKDPQFFPCSSQKGCLSKNVIESSINELILFRNAINRYWEETFDEHMYFSNFVKNSNIYNKKEKELILEEHFDFSWYCYDENDYFDKIAKIDFRGVGSKKAQEDEKMFAELFPGKKLY